MKYEKPLLDIVLLEREDIVCTSALSGEERGDNNGGWTEG